MSEWLIYSAVIPVSPVLLVYFAQWIAPNATPTFFSIIRDGQLCFYCTATCASLMKDLVSMGTNIHGFTIGWLSLLIIFSAVIYGVAVSNGSGEGVETKLGWTSILMAFITTILVLSVRNTVGVF